MFHRDIVCLLLQLPIPVDRFLYPEESDVELIRLYFQSLLSRRLQPQWSPLLYVIAVHHVNRFIYNQEQKHTRLKHGMILQAQKSPHKVRQGDVWPFNEISISSVRYICFVLIISFLFNRSYVSIYCTTKQSTWGKWMGLNCIKNFLKYGWIFSSASKAWNVQLSTFYRNMRSFLYHNTKIVSFKKNEWRG